jgi:CBS domain-containing protein
MKTNVGSIASRIVVVAEPDTTVARASELMRENHVGALIVTEATGMRDRALGILTDRDIVVEVLAMGLDPKVLTAGDVMSTNLVTAREDEAVFDALDRMKARGVRRLPVLDTADRLVGVLTLDDVNEFIADELSAVARTIRVEQRREASERRILA